MRRGLSRHSNKSSGNFFSPLSLFAGGVNGVWYDPSDSSTLFEDTAGTTPSPTPGAGALSVVGLMLDKSQGLALGSELVVSPYSGSASGSWAVSATSVTRNSSAAGQASVNLGAAISTSNYYLVTFVVSNLSGDDFFFRIGAGGLAYRVSANGTYTARVIGGGTSSSILFAPWAGTAGEATITNISVKSIAGNHAISYNTTTARPELSARVNLLTYSENLNGTGWSTLFGGTGTTPTITSNYAAAPDGTITASRFVGTRGASNTTSDYSLSVSPGGTVSIGASYVGSVYIKSNTGSTQNVTIYVSTGAAVQQIVAVAGSTWTRVTPAALTATTTPCNIVIGTRGGSYGGDQSLDILVWGADLRPANIGTSVPAYQRIADQYTYDSSGFPRYLVFNGTASGMYTPANLNLSGTDKATVFAGVRKISDAAAGILTELSVNQNLNAGSFLITVPNGANTVFDATLSQGNTITYNSASYTDLAAPITTVNSISFDKALSTDEVVFIRKNGANQSLTRSLNGNTTGNFGSYPLFIGSRNNGSIWLNGYIYSLIVVGAASTAAQISSTESWVAAKTPLGTL